MVFGLILKILDIAARNNRRQAEMQDAVRRSNEADRVRGKKQKKKKNRAGESAPAAVVAAPASPPHVVTEDPSYAEHVEPAAPKRDLRRMFIIGELLDPPVALREEE